MHNTIDVYQNINNYNPRKSEEKKLNVFDNKKVPERLTELFIL